MKKTISTLLLSLLAFSSVNAQNSNNIETLKKQVVKMFYDVPFKISYKETIKKLRKAKEIELIESSTDKSKPTIVIKSSSVLNYLGEQVRIQYFDDETKSDFDLMRARFLTVSETRIDTASIKKLTVEFNRIISVFDKLCFKKVEHKVHGVEDKYLGNEYFFYSSSASYLNDKMCLSISLLDYTGDSFDPAYKLQIVAFEDYFF